LQAGIRFYDLWKRVSLGVEAAAQLQAQPCGRNTHEPTAKLEAFCQRDQSALLKDKSDEFIKFFKEHFTSD
jgi:hypothetical protein